MNVLTIVRNGKSMFNPIPFVDWVLPQLKAGFERRLDEAEMLSIAPMQVFEAVRDADLVLLFDCEGGDREVLHQQLNTALACDAEACLLAKPLFVLALADTSEGSRAMQAYWEKAPAFTGLSLIERAFIGGFSQHFSETLGILHPAMRQDLATKLDYFKSAFQRDGMPLAASEEEFGEGLPLPEWELESIDRSPVPKVSDFRGKPLLILFYYLGCPGCKGRALPYANRIVYDDLGIQVLGIHTRFDGPMYSDEEILASNAEFYVRFPVFRDKDFARTYFRYEALGTPHWVLVDGEGKVVKSMFGSDPNNALLRLDLKIQEMLGV